MNGTDEDAVFLEDVTVGETISCGSVTVTEEEITDFAERFDPLAIHTDPSAAAESRYDGLIASGYHTLSLSVRLLVEAVRKERAVIAGLGIDDVRWREPVRPGDTLSVTTTITDARVSESDPGTGVIDESIAVTNQDGVEVLTLENHELLERRSP